MIYKMHQSKDDIIGFHVSGKLTDADYKDVLIPELEKAIAQWGKISAFVQLEDFQGFDAQALWDDFAVAAKYHNALVRLAVVGDRAWEERATNLLKHFTRTEVKFFEPARAHRGWIWLREKEGEQEP
ncbi:MAG: STAS/SEC14 domain-containing protein [Caldilineaceae bacterium]|nr:STAS/SEC14 domain-containing protein [Caldilineaceae bacterium]